MRALTWILIASYLVIVGLYPPAADLLGLAGGVAIRGVLAVLEQSSVQVLLALGMLVRLVLRRAA